MDDKQPAEKKIIVDEDWKSRAQAEKEEAKAAERAVRTEQNRGPMPPATISVLFASLATQSFICLGLIPNPLSEKVEQDLEQAKHLIDLLGVLDEKTKGNLTPDEKRQLDSLLFDLRMHYVKASAGSRESGVGRRESGVGGKG